MEDGTQYVVVACPAEESVEVRDRVSVAAAASQEEVENLAFTRPKVQEWIGGKSIRRTVFAAERMLNIITET